MFRNFKLVSRMVFGRGCFNQLGDILEDQQSKKDGFMVFLLDDVDNCIYLLLHHNLFPKLDQQM